MIAAVAVLATIVSGAPPKPQLAIFPGRSLWTLALNNELMAAPSYTKTSGYFALEGDQLVAYDLATGTERWLTRIRALSAPAIGDGLVFVAEPGAVTALHDATGLVAWRQPLAEPLASAMVWDNGWLIAATAQGTIAGIRAADGETIWRADLGVRAHAAPALAADRVYVPAADGRLIALRVDTGARVWERRLGGAPNQPLALEDRIYVGSEDKYFYCVNAETGAVDWRWRTGANVTGLPVVDEDRVYFVALDNTLRALDRGSGSQRWQRLLPFRPTNGVLMAADSLVVNGIAPAIRAFRLADGSPAGEHATAGEMAAPVHVITNPATLLPVIVTVTHDLGMGATVTAVTRAVEPPIQPIAPLQPGTPARPPGGSPSPSSSPSPSGAPGMPPIRP